MTTRTEETIDFGLGVAIDSLNEEKQQLAQVSVSDGGVRVGFPIIAGVGDIHSTAREILWFQAPINQELTLLNYQPNRTADGTVLGFSGRASSLFKGAFLESDDFLKAIRVQMVSDAFRDFLQLSPLNTKADDAGISIAADWKVTILEHDTQPEGRLEISVERRIGTDQEGMKISEALFVSHYRSKPLPVADSFDLLQGFDALMMTLTGAHDFSTQFAIWIKDNESKERKCDLYPRSRINGTRGHAHGARFVTLPKLGIELHDLLSNWSRSWGRIAPSVGIFLRWQTSKSKVFNETDFFLLSQAHEVFVNRTAGDNGKLGEKLFTSIGQWIPSFSTKDPRTYCDEIASSRNWFTHFNPKYDARDKHRSYEYLYEYCKVLEITYIALILKLSGVGDTALTQLVSSMIEESRGFFVGTVVPT